MNAISKNLNFCGIYMIINLINNHKYIGSSINIKRRLEMHRFNLRHNHHSNPHLQNAWNKYGEDNFVFNILEKCSKEKRFEREQYYIDTIKPKYNICTEVVQNPPTSEESRKKHSITRKKLMAEGKIPLTHNTPTYAYYKDGTFVGQWQSIRKAAFALGLNPSSVLQCINGKAFQVKGYKFFKEAQENVQPFEKPKNRDNPNMVFNKNLYKIIDTVTGECLYFLGLKAIASYFSTNLSSVMQDVGGKHKFKRRYMIYKNTAV